MSLSKELWWARLLFWSAAGFLGVLAVSVAAICDVGSDIFLDLYERSHYLPFFICPFGFWMIWRIQKAFFHGVEGSGIPQVMASLNSRSPTLRDKLLNLRNLIGKVICTFLGMLAGASIGREGPSVQIGASLFNFLGHYGRFSKFERRQGLVIAGAAAGLSAAFNAPLAGIVFAIEELKGSFEERTSGLMLSAVILAGLISLAILGHYTYFGRIRVGMDSFSGAIAVMLLASIGGFMGGLFSKTLLSLGPKLHSWRPNQPWLVPLLMGFVVASLGYFSQGKSFGTGYHQAQMLLHSENTSTILFPFYKIASILATYITGISGGIFAPSLSVGAGFGTLVSPLFYDVPREALLLIGMVSYLSGVIRAPVTAFVIVFEMTENHLLLIPLMAASFLATGVSKSVCSKPLYKSLSERFLGPST